MKKISRVFQNILFYVLSMQQSNMFLIDIDMFVTCIFKYATERSFYVMDIGRWHTVYVGKRHSVCQEGQIWG